MNDLAKGFNESQKDYKVVPVYKGTYDESMTAAIAAFRAGNAPHILQVFEVGTATMMASKGAIKPVAEVMREAGYKFGVVTARKSPIVERRCAELGVEIVRQVLDPADGDADRGEASGELAGVRVTGLTDRELRADAQELGRA